MAKANVFGICCIPVAKAKEKKECNYAGADLRRANLCGADLSGVNLEGADLSYASLCHANLAWANLKDADLYGADLYGARLSCATLCNANLRRANLCGASLYSACLSCATLCNANLKRANLYGADLSGANLKDADLYDANLECTNLYKTLTDSEYITGKILREPIKGYKKCRDNIIITLEIPKGAVVFSINNHKCRTNKAKVIDVDYGYGNRAYSLRTGMSYYVGDEITINNFNCQYNIECAEGIHFFLNEFDAIQY